MSELKLFRVELPIELTNGSCFQSGFSCRKMNEPRLGSWPKRGSDHKGTFFGKARLMAISQPIPASPRFQDLTEQQFGRLAVLSFAGAHKSRSRWNCRCDCGELCIVEASTLKRQTTPSCGCLTRELAAKRMTTHGLSRSREYQIWQSMVQRCSNKNHKRFADYGGRGIQVCKRWLESFTAFVSDMGMRPTINHSLDRFPNLNGDYEPGNCRWATDIEQNRNKRTNRLLVLDGRSQCIAAWAAELSLKESTIRERKRRGFTDTEALRGMP